MAEVMLMERNKLTFENLDKLERNSPCTWGIVDRSGEHVRVVVYIPDWYVNPGNIGKGIIRALEKAKIELDLEV